MHGWTRPDPAGSGLAGGGPGGVSRGRTGPRPRVPEARGPTGLGVGTMMPGETHSAAPGTAADLSRCQGCASLQQVRRLPGPRARRSSVGRPGRGAGGPAPRCSHSAAEAPPPPLPTPLSTAVVWGAASFVLFRPVTQDSFAVMRRWRGGASEFWRAPALTQSRGSPGLILRLTRGG